MRTLDPQDRAILRSHPDELETWMLLYLRLPANQDVLAEYEATWADPIATRRQRATPSQLTAQCSSSSSSS